MANQIETVRRFIRLIDDGSTDEALALTTKDFVYKFPNMNMQTAHTYNVEPAAGVNADKFKELHKIVHTSCSNFTTDILSVTEDGDIVHVQGKTKYNVDIPASVGEPKRIGPEETTFKSDYTFNNGKIALVNATTGL